MRINWNRGSWRLWVVGSVAWVILSVAIIRPDEAVNTIWKFRNVNVTFTDREVGIGDLPLTATEERNVELRIEVARRLDRAKRTLEDFALFGLLPPAVALVIGFALVWAIRGFTVTV
jgi:hypothetical protein